MKRPRMEEEPFVSKEFIQLLKDVNSSTTKLMKKVMTSILNVVKHQAMINKASPFKTTNLK